MSDLLREFIWLDCFFCSLPFCLPQLNRASNYLVFVTNNVKLFDQLNEKYIFHQLFESENIGFSSAQTHRSNCRCGCEFPSLCTTVSKNFGWRELLKWHSCIALFCFDFPSIRQYLYLITRFQWIVCWCDIIIKIEPVSNTTGQRMLFSIIFKSNALIAPNPKIIANNKQQTVENREQNKTRHLLKYDIVH